MSILQAIILGIVQGIAEFLPISSSGHLVVLQRVFGMEEPALTFDIILHVGTLVSIVVVFWNDIWKLIKNPFSKMTGLLIVGTIPAVVVGFLLRDVIENYLRSGIFLAAAFTLTGFLLLIADRFPVGTKTNDRDITYIDAIIVGMMQALALPPGISRSGMTITGALSRGLNRETAARFSFMLAIIVIAGAGAFEAVEFFIEGSAAYETVGAPQMIVGFVVSALVGFLAIKLLLKLIKACKLRYFSYYLWVLAAVILADYLFVNMFF